VVGGSEKKKNGSKRERERDGERGAAVVCSLTFFSFTFEGKGKTSPHAPLSPPPKRKNHGLLRADDYFADDVPPRCRRRGRADAFEK